MLSLSSAAWAHGDVTSQAAVRGHP